MTPTAATRRSTRKPKGDGHLRRAEILEAAERIFVADGYDGATIRKIADEVGVSSTALYMHFTDKSCILREISQRTITLLLERNKEIAAKPVEAGARLRQMLDSYMRWGFEHPNTYKLVFSGPNPVSPDKGETVADLSARCYEIFSGVVREVAEAGRLRSGTAESAAQVLWACCHGTVMLKITRPEVDWAPVDELLNLTLDGLIHGLVAD